MTKPTLHTQVRVLARQLGWDYADLQWDHIHARKLGGKDDRHSPDNWQALPIAAHKIKTFGKPATTYGSDIHAIAKTKRNEKKTAAFNARMAQGLARHEKPAPSKWAGQKLRSRPFQKRKERG